MSDIVVIGGGVNGLAAAVELARAGKKVLVLESRGSVGGLSGRRTFGDGFVVPGVRHETCELRSALVDSLGLTQHGLVLANDHAPVFAAEPSGPGLVVHTSAEKAKEEIGKRSKKDADAYAAFRGLLDRIRPALEPLLARSAPPLLPRSLGEMVDMGLMGLKLRGLGRGDMIELLRVVPMCVADWMREQFETEVLSAALSMPAVLGDFVGPWSPGTAAMLILREALLMPGAKGGPAAVVDALQAALSKAGGTVRTGARVTKIRTEGSRVKGVVLEGGEDVSADAIIAACSPRRALELLPPMSLSVKDLSAARAIRSRGTVAKIHLGLREAPSWRARGDQRFERVRIGAHLDDLERGFDAAKYRRLPERPALDICVPDAVSGKPVMSIFALGVPYALEGGWSAEKKSELLESVLRELEHHTPIRDLVVASEVISPVDIEVEYGVNGGSIHHVERAIDQMVLLRPARPFARYATPVEGLFLGSSGCHPGPGVTLAPGVLAARALLGGGSTF
jgi:phytoene dehydrogenase-like protein